MGQNSLQLLNRIMEATPFDNVRTKNAEYYDERVITAAQPVYNYFVQPVNNPFVNNKQVPLSGSEIFFLKEIAAYLRTSDNLPIISMTDLDLILNRSFLFIKNNARDFLKIPLVEILNFYYAPTFGTAAFTRTPTSIIARSKKLTRPILFNSTIASTIQIVFDPLVTTAGRQFVGDTLRLEFKGTQFDKLQTFLYDAIKESQFDEIDYTIYDSRLGVAGAATTQLFNDANRNELEWSKVFPMGANETFQLESIEFCFLAPNNSLTDASNQKHNDTLTVTVNDVNLLQTDLRKLSTLYATLSSDFDDVGDTISINVQSFEASRYIYVLETPILFPAIGTQSIVHAQETGFATWYSAMFKGTLTRGLA